MDTGREVTITVMDRMDMSMEESLDTGMVIVESTVMEDAAEDGRNLRNRL